MKKMLITIFSTICLQAAAQITISNATFPAAGDTLSYLIDDEPSNINPATAPGGNQTWDFTSLSPDEDNKTIFRTASSGTNAANYPGADLVVSGTDGETYFNLTADKLEVLGFAGIDPAGFGLEVKTKFSPPFSERKAPLNFFDVNQQTTNLTLPLSTENIPDSLFQGAPFVPDSIRIRLNTQRLELVDGWGICKIPGGEYSVLRQKRTEYTETKLDIFLGGFIGWVDLSTLIDPNNLPFGGFIGIDTTVSYRFLNNVEKEEIAVATMSDNLSSVETVRYKDNMTVSTDEGLAPGSPSVQAFPNPAVDKVKIDCRNLVADRYTLRIFNIIGKVVLEQQHAISGSKIIQLDLQDFKKGTYLYSLINSKGNIVGTKRLVVLKP